MKNFYMLSFGLRGKGNYQLNDFYRILFLISSMPSVAKTGW